MKRWECWNQVLGENKSAEQQAREMLETFISENGGTNEPTKRLEAYRKWLEEEGPNVLKTSEKVKIDHKREYQKCGYTE